MGKVLSNKRLRLGLALKLFKNGKVVRTIVSHSKTSIFVATPHNTASEWDTGRLRATYKPGYWNEADFTDLDDPRQGFYAILSNFTELALVKEFV